VLASHFLLSPSASFSSGATALIAAADAIYPSSVGDAIEAEMIDRDLLG
jgi:hypothetical protein